MGKVVCIVLGILGFDVLDMPVIQAELFFATCTPSPADWLKLRSLTRPTSVTSPPLRVAAESDVKASRQNVLTSQIRDNQDFWGFIEFLSKKRFNFVKDWLEYS